jgi:hypothetical protein
MTLGNETMAVPGHRALIGNAQGRSFLIPCPAGVANPLSLSLAGGNHWTAHTN